MTTLALLLLVSSVLSEKFAPFFKSNETSALVELDNSNFTQWINSSTESNASLVLFKAEWCQYCRYFETELNEVLKVNTRFPIAKLDVAKHKDYASRFDLPTVPALYLFKKPNLESPKLYLGGRDREGVLYWLQREELSSSSIPEVSSVAEGDENLSVNSAIAYNCSSTFKERLMILLPDLRLYHSKLEPTSSLQLIPAYNNSNDNCTLYVKAASSSFERWKSGESNLEGAVEFLTYFILAQERVLPMNQVTSHFVFTSMKPIALIISDDKEKDMIQKLVTHSKFGEFLVAKSGTKLSYEKQLLDFLKISFWLDNLEAEGITQELRTPLVLWMQRIPKFSDKSATAIMKSLWDGKEDLVEWANKGLNWELLPSDSIGSTSPEPSEQKGVLFTLVSKTFESLVYKGDMDVFVLFHAPWCVHCVKLSAVLEKVALKFATSPILFATFNVDSEEIPPIPVSGTPPWRSLDFGNGLPGLVFFPRMAKSSNEPSNGRPAPIVYGGARTFKDVKDFVIQHHYSSSQKKIDEF